MDDIKKLVEALSHHNGLEMTKYYLSPSPEGGNVHPQAVQPSSRKLPLKVEDCTDYKFGRNVPKIVAVWTTFANIDWLTSESRDDVALIETNGADALSRLLPVALRDTNQSKHVAGFLLNLYNGERFHFDMCHLGSIDHELFLDCITVLMMDFSPGPEIHTYFENGNAVFEGIAEDWGFKDYTKKS